MKLRISMKNYQKSLVEERQLKIKFDAERGAYETAISQLTFQVTDLQNEVKSCYSYSDTITAKNIEIMKNYEKLKIEGSLDLKKSRMENE